MADRQHYSSGAPWESIAGYSRAIRTGNLIYVAGTVATDETGAIIGGDDPYAQTLYVIRKIENALKQLGGSLEDVVRTRMFVVNVDQWQAITRAHGEVFAEIRPASTLVEVSRLIGSGYLIEMEADAVVTNSK